jgi:hypothetical protein
MSDKKKDFPRDLRGLCGGVVKEADGSERVLPFPVKSYFNLWEYITGLEQWLEDFDGSNEDKESLSKHLEREKADLPELKQRILDHFKVRSGVAGKSRVSAGVDHEAKSKVEKALADIEAGIYDPSKKSKTMRAVFKALAFNQKHNRMPNRKEMLDPELVGMQFNVREVTDAGKWLAQQNKPFPNPLFSPLSPERRGRPSTKSGSNFDGTK